MRRLLFQLKKTRARRLRGFTLIELLVVITIIGILMTLVVVTIGPIQRRSRDSKRKADVNLFISGLTLFQADFKLYPNYTFYLGTNGGDTGAKNSYFDLGSDIASCVGNSSAGAPKSFVRDAATPIGTVDAADNSSYPTTYTYSGALNLSTASSYNSLVLKPGFQSVNQLLVCLKYLDRVITDPKPNATNLLNYQYRINYDYTQFLVNSQAENQNDPILVSNLFPSPLTPNGANISPKRYFEGNGRNVRQLDDNADMFMGPSSFYQYSTNGGSGDGTSSDGRYFYQCIDRVAGETGNGTHINRDSRSLSTYDPIVYSSSGGTWKANALCFGNTIDIRLDSSGQPAALNYYDANVQSH